ncbi:hypothetical protein SORBI_3001G072250 [Sorghum bicolor]|uniref:Uncharacterized protein n=1 Tax=Sorghum bicolor TaxID=4558 RepID=A0A1Z5S517_SORBI|nr:hypothetical protein SORBI_3001G072250 [Sorghum bicolor]
MAPLVLPSSLSPCGRPGLAWTRPIHSRLLPVKYKNAGSMTSSVPPPPSHTRRQTAARLCYPPLPGLPPSTEAAVAAATVARATVTGAAAAAKCCCRCSRDADVETRNGGCLSLASSSPCVSDGGWYTGMGPAILSGSSLGAPLSDPPSPAWHSR